MAVTRRYNPDGISDQIAGRYPLRLVRLCLQELYRLLGLSNQTTQTLGSLPGSPGSGSGPGSLLATRELNHWTGNGPYRVDSNVDGAWVATTAMNISGLNFWRRVSGTAGSTVLDLKLNGSSMYTATPRPTVIPGQQIGTAPVPDVTHIAVGDAITVDVLSVESGRPSDWRLTLEGA
jgi:hypothetical protein